MLSSEIRDVPLSPQMTLGAALGVAAGALTLSASKLSAISDNHVLGVLQRSLFVLVLPGIVGAEAVSGNIHAWPLWLAAAINLAIYFVVGWLVYWVVRKLLRRGA